MLNGVAEALRLRIARAHREGKTFRVIVVMPLLPSFEGEGEREGGWKGEGDCEREREGGRRGGRWEEGTEGVRDEQ